MPQCLSIEAVQIELSVFFFNFYFYSKEDMRLGWMVEIEVDLKVGGREFNENILYSCIKFSKNNKIYF